MKIYHEFGVAHKIVVDMENHIYNSTDSLVFADLCNAIKARPYTELAIINFKLQTGTTILTQPCACNLRINDDGTNYVIDYLGYGTLLNIVKATGVATFISKYNTDDFSFDNEHGLTTV